MPGLVSPGLRPVLGDAIVSSLVGLGDVFSICLCSPTQWV